LISGGFGSDFDLDWIDGNGDSTTERIGFDADDVEPDCLVRTIGERVDFGVIGGVDDFDVFNGGAGGGGDGGNDGIDLTATAGDGEDSIGEVCLGRTGTTVGLETRTGSVLSDDGVIGLPAGMNGLETF